MRKRYKLRKGNLLILFLILIFIIAMIFLIKSLFKNKSYSLEYSIDDYKINENYQADNNLYYYEIVYEDVKYNFIYPSNYLKEKKLISNIEEYEDEEYTCLTIESDYISTNPLCSYQDEIIDYRLTSDKLKEEFKYEELEYEPTEIGNYEVYSSDDILMWSYKGFNYLKSDQIKEIKLFDKDIYDLPLATKINEYLVIPDYEQNYSFDKVYIIDLNSKKLDEWDLDYSISFDSYVLGINDRSVFILDSKNKIEYELVPHKKKMRKVAKNNQQGVVYENGEQKKISMNKLLSSTYKFTYKQNYNYSIENNKLYLSYVDNSIKTRVSNENITSIIYQTEDEVYYLIGTTLYKFNLKEGQKKLIKYPEWEFNYENLIFVNK